MYWTTKIKSDEEWLTHFIVSGSSFPLTLDLSMLVHRGNRHQQCKRKYNLPYDYKV